MKKERSELMRIRNAGALLLLVVALICSVGLRAQAQEEDAILARAGDIVCDLTSSNALFDSADSALANFTLDQAMFLPIAPPDPNFSLYAVRGEIHAFDPTGFPADLVSALVPESYKGRAYVYPIAIVRGPRNSRPCGL